MIAGMSAVIGGSPGFGDSGRTRNDFPPSAPGITASSITVTAQRCFGLSKGIAPYAQPTHFRARPSLFLFRDAQLDRGFGAEAKKFFIPWLVLFHPRNGLVVRFAGGVFLVQFVLSHG